MLEAGRSGSHLDMALLAGFRFQCRPDCGLCCYASPAVSPPERAALLQIRPELPFEPVEGDEGFVLLPTRPDGGACVLLRANRCTAHEARPFPCRTFPVHGHVGRRLQATLVLSCPGLDLTPLHEWGTSEDGTRPPVGLDGELEALRAESRKVPILAWEGEALDAEQRLLRRLRRGGAAEEPSVVRAELRQQLVAPDPAQELVLPPPGEDAAVEELPVLFDRKYGRVALRSTELKTYELFALHETGSSPDRLAEIPLPDELPGLETAGRATLDGYLRYLLDRDHFLWSTYQEVRSGRDGALSDQLAANLTEAATEVVRRGTVLARFRGRAPERLGPEEILDGVKALDAELLDRPTLGRIL